MTKRMTMEALLGWAYRQELPKHGSGRMISTPGMSGWGAVERYAELLTVIDANAFGCISDFVETSEPHADALAIAAAVSRLSTVEAEPGDDVLSDIAMLTAIEREECNMRGFVLAQIRGDGLVKLVVRHALLGTIPAWASHGEVVREFERGANGRPLWRRTVSREAGEGRPAMSIEIDGYDAAKSRPHPGAWRRAILTPDPALLAAERIEYQAYVQALGVLAEELTPILTFAAINGVATPSWPWEGEAFRTPPKIFHQYRSMA